MSFPGLTLLEKPVLKQRRQSLWPLRGPGGGRAGAVSCLPASLPSKCSLPSCEPHLGNILIKNSRPPTRLNLTIFTVETHKIFPGPRKVSAFQTFSFKNSGEYSFRQWQVQSEPHCCSLVWAGRGFWTQHTSSFSWSSLVLFGVSFRPRRTTLTGKP